MYCRSDCCCIAAGLQPYSCLQSFAKWHDDIQFRYGFCSVPSVSLFRKAILYTVDGCRLERDSVCTIPQKCQSHVVLLCHDNGKSRCDDYWALISDSFQVIIIVLSTPPPLLFFFQCPFVGPPNCRAALLSGRLFGHGSCCRASARLDLGRSIVGIVNHHLSLFLFVTASLLYL
jgi:hypothetical protein